MNKNKCCALLFYVIGVNLNVIAGYALTKCYGVCHKRG